MEINRRNFLKLIGGATAGAGLSTWILSSLHSSPNYSKEEFLSGPGIESRVNSLCDLCECGCGISVRLIDGVPVKIEGNKLHPINRGGVCVRGQAGLEVLYNPDRIKGPIKRIGERGSGKWQKVSWEEALQAVLENLHESQQPDALMFLVNGLNEPLDRLLKRFAKAYGTPYYFSTGLTFPNQIHYHFMQGNEQEYAYDLERTNYILSFGAHFLESEPALGWYTRMYGYLRRERQGPRVKIVQLDPQLSITGIKADEWVPIKPGTYGALALGIAHLLIREEQYDKEFIKNNTFGFDDWQDQQGKKHIGFKDIILRDYSPRVVSKITGVKPRTLVRLANEFATNKPALAMVGSRCAWLSDGAHTVMAVHALNALVGSIGVAGGIVPRKSVPFTKLPSIKRGKISKERNNLSYKQFSFNGNWISADSLRQLLTKNSPQQIKNLFLYKANPFFYSTNRAELQKALAAVPFIVSFSSFQDETTQFADLVLPDHVFLEKWQAATSAPGVAIVHLGISAPVLKPLYDTRNIADVILTLANKLGGSISKSIPWENYEAYLKAITEGVFHSGQGVAFSESYDESWVRFLKERGWRYPVYFSFDEFWDDLKQKGGWWEPKFQKQFITFNTPSKKFEFYSQILKNELEQIQRLSSEIVTPEKVGLNELGDEWFLPNYKVPSKLKAQDGFNFYLNPYILTTIGSGEGANQPMMLEILGIHIKHKWNSWIEINPNDAAEMGLGDLDWVWLVSPRGKIRMQVRLCPAAMPGVVSIPLGLGHRGYGRFADKKGVNFLSILLSNSDPVTGQNAWAETRVKLIKI